MDELRRYVGVLNSLTKVERRSPRKRITTYGIQCVSSRRFRFVDLPFV